MTPRSRRYFEMKKAIRRYYSGMASDIFSSILNTEMIQQSPIPHYPAGGTKSGWHIGVGAELNELDIELRKKQHRAEKQAAIANGIIETAQNIMVRSKELSEEIERIYR